MSTKNKHGNTVEYGFNSDCDRSRYYYDCGKGLPGETKDWRQFDTDQDASYYGVWVNFVTRQSFCYAEGDTTLVTCEDEEHWRLELQSMVDFHGPPPAHLRSIDAVTGELLGHPIERPTIENPNPMSHRDKLTELLG